MKSITRLLSCYHAVPLYSPVQRRATSREAQQTPGAVPLIHNTDANNDAVKEGKIKMSIVRLNYDGGECPVYHSCNEKLNNQMHNSWDGIVRWERKGWVGRLHRQHFSSKKRAPSGDGVCMKA